MASKTITLTREQLTLHTSTVCALGDIQYARRAIKNSTGCPLPEGLHRRMQAVEAELASIQKELERSTPDNIWRLFNL